MEVSAQGIQDSYEHSLPGLRCHESCRAVRNARQIEPGAEGAAPTHSGIGDGSGRVESIWPYGYACGSASRVDRSTALASGLPCATGSLPIRSPARPDSDCEQGTSAGRCRGCDRHPWRRDDGGETRGGDARSSAGLARRRSDNALRPARSRHAERRPGDSERCWSCPFVAMFFAERWSWRNGAPRAVPAFHSQPSRRSSRRRRRAPLSA